MTATIKDLIENLALLPTTDAVRRKNNSYAQNEAGAIIAISLSGSKVSTINLTKEDQYLEHLYLNANKALATLHFRTALPHLQHFYIEECALEELIIPAGCAALQQLYARKNQLKQVVFEGDCPSLELLDLSENELSEITISYEFGQLQYLYLNDNQLRQLYLQSTLTVLNTLHLQNNRFREDLPEVLTNKILYEPTTFETINLRGNAPKNIPKIFVRGNNCIENARLWFEELRDNKPTGENTTIKLMFLGNGHAGKTSLVCALKNGNCPHEEDYHKSTHGIQIERLTIEGVDFNVWDFGGQEIYHGTHKLFLESEALQLLLFDTKTEERARNGTASPDRTTADPVKDNPIEYWYATAYNKSKDSIFFFVQNKIDIFPNINSEVEEFIKKHKAEFKRISAKKGENIRSFRVQLLEQAEKLPAYLMKMPASWLSVCKFFTDNLEKKKDTIKLITEQKFLAICRNAKVGEKTISLLRTYLHHNGFIYDNKQLKNEEGEQVIIADQRWALQAIYKPYNRDDDKQYKEFKKRKGIIQVRRLFEAFDKQVEGEEPFNYREQDKWLFLDFMKSCGLCFLLNDKPWQEKKSMDDFYVVLEFLPDKPSQIVVNAWRTAQEFLVFRYPLPWRDIALIQSFINSLGRKTSLDHIWKTGIHIAEKEGNFKVVLDQEGANYFLMLHIDKSATDEWLIPIFRELDHSLERNKWEVSDNYNKQYRSFDLDSWKREKESSQANKTRDVVDRKDYKSKPSKKKKQKKKTNKNEKLQDKLKTKNQQAEGVKYILFIEANPLNDGIKTNNEHRVVSQRALNGVQDKYILQTLLSAQITDLIRAFRTQPHIIHFAGHGTEKGIIITNNQNEEIILEKPTIKRLFKKLEGHTELVLLNCCNSADQAEFISKFDMTVVGHNIDIADPAAIAFTEGFYTGLSLGESYEEAFNDGMTSLLTYYPDSEDIVEVWHSGEQLDW